MAGKSEEVNLHLTAQDDATKAVVALDKRLDGLTDDEKEVILQASAKQAQQEIDKLTRRLAEAHRYDDEQIAVFVEARGNAQQRLDAIQAELREIDGKRVEAEVVADTGQAEASVGRLTDKLRDLDGPIGDVVGKLDKLATPAGGVAAIAAGLLLAGDHAADLAIEADDIARLTGDSVEEASRLNAVWKRTGADSKDLQDVLLQMQGVLSSNAELAESLGINLNDGRSIGERFIQVVGLLQTEFTNTAERSVAASELFGEEGIRQVNAVIGQVGDLGAALEDVPDAQVVTDQNITEARAYKQRVSELKTELEALAVQVGENVLPALTRVAGILTDIVTTIERIKNADIAGVRIFPTSINTDVEKANALLTTFTGTVDEFKAALTAAGVEGDAFTLAIRLYTEQQAEIPAAADAARTAIGANTTALDEQATAADAATVKLAYWADRAVDGNERVADAAARAADAHAEHAEVVEGANQQILDSFDEARSSAEAGLGAIASGYADTSKAADMTASEIVKAQEKATAAQEAWINKVDLLKEAYGEDLIGDVLDYAAEQGPEVGQKLIDGLASGEITPDELETMFGNMDAQASRAAETAIDVAADAAAETAKQVFPKVGDDAADGLVVGLLRSSGRVEAAARKLAADAEAAIRDVLQTHSPSEVFERIGRDVVEGLALGIINETPAAAIDAAYAAGQVTEAMANALRARFVKDEARDAIEDVADAIQDEWDAQADPIADAAGRALDRMVDAAQERARAARDRVSDVLGGISGRGDLADARERVSDTERSLVEARERRGVTDAERRLADARRAGDTERIADAERDLADAREEAEERISDTERDLERANDRLLRELLDQNGGHLNNDMLELARAAGWTDADVTAYRIATAQDRGAQGDLALATTTAANYTITVNTLTGALPEQSIQELIRILEEIERRRGWMK